MTRRESYNKYLRSAVWKSLRESALAYADSKCQLCNTPDKLNVHHRVYPKVLGTEPVNDLTVLCDRCHYGFHHNFTMKNKQNTAKIKQTPKTPAERKELLAAKRKTKRDKKKANKAKKLAANVTTRGIYSPETASIGGGTTNREYRLIKRGEARNK